MYSQLSFKIRLRYSYEALVRCALSVLRIQDNGQPAAASRSSENYCRALHLSNPTLLLCLKHTSAGLFLGQHQAHQSVCVCYSSPYRETSKQSCRTSTRAWQGKTHAQQKNAQSDVIAEGSNERTRSGLYRWSSNHCMSVPYCVQQNTVPVSDRAELELSRCALLMARVNVVGRLVCCAQASMHNRSMGPS